MGKKQRFQTKKPLTEQQAISPPITSLLDIMIDGREYESLLRNKNIKVDLCQEIRCSLQEIKSIRSRPIICYLANSINGSIKGSTAIDGHDSLPFFEMIKSIPIEHKEIDIILITSGGSAHQVAQFVSYLRPRFEKVNFIIPDRAMSAGTIFIMSGNEIIMSKNSYFGPIDPQVPNKNGFFVPAQSLLIFLEDIQKRGEEYIKKGENPRWTDIFLLREIDAKDMGTAISASRFSTDLVKDFLYTYKFSDWNFHSDKRPVTDQEKRDRAESIADFLCKHSNWNSHGYEINREIAKDKCKLKITHTESIAGLDRAINRFHALVNWMFENTPIAKIYISEQYSVFKSDKQKAE